MSGGDKPWSRDRTPPSSPTGSWKTPPPPEKGPSSSHRTPGVESSSTLRLEGFARAVFQELNRHLSEPNAKALLTASAAAAGVPLPALTSAHMAQVVSQVEKTFDIFGVRPELKASCLANLQALARAPTARAEIAIPIVVEDDVVVARTTGKDMCRDLGFTEVGYVKVATAISELARNILKYAGKGQVTLRILTGASKGLEVVAADQGPGIPDIEAVMSPRYKSRSGMGAGLRGTRKLMDHFEISSRVGVGTTVTVRKFKD